MFQISICAPLSAVLDFLASQYAEGKQYRMINSYHSAISMTHAPVDGVVVGCVMVDERSI